MKTSIFRAEYDYIFILFHIYIKYIYYTYVYVYVNMYIYYKYVLFIDDVVTYIVSFSVQLFILPKTMIHLGNRKPQ